MSPGPSDPVLKPVVGATYTADKKSWRQFITDSNIFKRAGYSLVTVCPLGNGSFGAVWHQVGEAKEVYASLFETEDEGEFPLQDGETSFF